MSHADVAILGAGVIGLSTALELHARGARVELHEPRAAATQASWAAAGMLAATDPYNPLPLLPFARLSAALYPAFLQDLEERTGAAVPFQTELTLQHTPGGEVQRLDEHSIDPRQLAVALLSAVQQAGIPLRRTLAQPGRQSVSAGIVVHATGAWAAAPEIFPRKGQMLRVRLPASAPLNEVHRSEHMYVVPRTAGPQAGTVLIGATIEDAGFNTDVVTEDLTELRQRGASLVPHCPALADSQQAPLVEAWAGLRPATPDGLPLLGELTAARSFSAQRQVIAAGHFRNGILLAPATAVLVADLLEGRPSAIDLAPFSPARFAPAGAPAA